jgi:hypothetical protein
LPLLFDYTVPKYHCVHEEQRPLSRVDGMVSPDEMLSAPSFAEKATGSDVKIFKALVFSADGSRPPATFAAIEHEGRMWLVLGWIEMPDKAVTMPKRIVPLDLFGYQMVPEEGFDLVVNAGMPTQLFDEEIPIELRSKFQVVERPNIQIPVGGGRIQ